MERPSCAVCLQPIRKGDQFSLAGTEVVHRECVVDLDRSKSNLQALRIIHLAADVARERGYSASVRVEIDEASNDVKAARKDRDRCNAEAAKYRALYEAGMAAEMRQARETLDQLRTLGRQRDDLRVELQRVRDEQVAMIKAVTPVRSPQIDHRDDTEIRFSLLELDTVCDNPLETTEMSGALDATPRQTTNETHDRDQAVEGGSRGLRGVRR